MSGIAIAASALKARRRPNQAYGKAPARCKAFERVEGPVRSAEVESEKQTASKPKI
jgi:hypothetical protein